MQSSSQPHKASILDPAASLGWARSRAEDFFLTLHFFSTISLVRRPHYPMQLLPMARLHEDQCWPSGFKADWVKLLATNFPRFLGRGT